MAENTPARTIAAGYDTEGAALELGTVLVDGTPDPEAKVRIPLAMLNRHGLVAGATGTGKTKTLQALAGQLSDNGVPVLLADVKGDLSGLARAGESNAKLEQRAADTGDDWTPTAYPTQFLSLGDGGIAVPVRATLTQFGPILLSKVLGLNATQESTLGLIFHWADQRQLPLLDTKDLRAVIQHLTSDEGKADLKGIGGVSSATAGVILRALVNLEAQGGDTFFGEPEFDPADLMTVVDGKGTVTLLELAERAANPTLFSTFLMWLLAELYEELPEAGDLDRPKLVFFFDEAHLLFADASKAFLERIEQTVKLIRSKGVGVFFCTQLPTDIPNEVLSQLGARVQHALRAFTPDDQKALNRTVKTYPKSDVYDLESALTSLGTGEAIVTVLSETGAPTPVAWTRLRAPRSMMAAIGDDAVREEARKSPLQAKYGEMVDRDSAYERLTGRMTEAAGEEPAAPGQPAPEQAPPPAPQQEDEGGFISKVGAFLQSPTGRQLTNTVTREVTRSLFGTRRRR
ncbi:helicase HerA-like domain-containing protein [Pseudonocardia phyllosphaerae]|uniref:helicase HerA-like domain-containing protein n=1 Tax=Pseudonocardia phyllosphaerae TaxID=3390502 RepID=UPI00397CD2E7